MNEIFPSRHRVDGAEEISAFSPNTVRDNYDRYKKFRFK